MNNYFIIHGSFSSPYTNWIPYLSKEISKRKLNAFVPHLPCLIGVQNYENWEEILISYVQLGLINENTVIFTHSSSCVFICKFLILNKIKVKRIITVCGFNNLSINEKFDSVNHTFYLDKLNLIKKYCSDIVSYYTLNDPYVKYENAKEFAECISDKIIVIENGGHLDSVAGFKEFPQLLNHLD